VLIAGGMERTGPVLGLEVIRVDGERVSVVQSSESTGVGPIFHAAAPAPSGTVMLSGGYATVADAEPNGGLPRSPSREVELWGFEPRTGQLSRVCTGSLGGAGRGAHASVVIGRRAIFLGGRGADGLPLQEAEVATLGSGASCFIAPPEPKIMAQARANAAVAVLEASREVLVVGGRIQTAGDPFGLSSNVAEVFSPSRDPLAVGP
jgi:hypothetical protein